MNLDSIDWTDNTAIDELRRQIARDDQQALVETLKNDLAIPLPEVLEERTKAVTVRGHYHQTDSGTQQYYQDT